MAIIAFFATETTQIRQTSAQLAKGAVENWQQLLSAITNHVVT
jgi:hypothetical protein